MAVEHVFVRLTLYDVNEIHWMFIHILNIKMCNEAFHVLLRKKDKHHIWLRNMDRNDKRSMLYTMNHHK